MYLSYLASDDATKNREAAQRPPAGGSNWFTNLLDTIFPNTVNINASVPENISISAPKSIGVDWGTSLRQNMPLLVGGGIVIAGTIAMLVVLSRR